LKTTEGNKGKKTKVKRESRRKGKLKIRPKQRCQDNMKKEKKRKGPSTEGGKGGSRNPSLKGAFFPTGAGEREKTGKILKKEREGKKVKRRVENGHGFETSEGMLLQQRGGERGKTKRRKKEPDKVRNSRSKRGKNGEKLHKRVVEKSQKRKKRKQRTGANTGKEKQSNRKDTCGKRIELSKEKKKGEAIKERKDKKSRKTMSP